MTRTKEKEMQESGRAKTYDKWRARMINLAYSIRDWSYCEVGMRHACILAIEGKYVVSTGFNGPNKKDGIFACHLTSTENTPL